MGLKTFLFHPEYVFSDITENQNQFIDLSRLWIDTKFSWGKKQKSKNPHTNPKENPRRKIKPRRRDRGMENQNMS